MVASRRIRSPKSMPIAGRLDKALEWLERAYQQHDAGLPYVQSDALFKGLHQNPRYLQLLRKMQIPQ